MRIILGIALVLCYNVSLSQSTSDSLWNVWSDISLPDTVRLQAINQLEWDHYLYTKPDSAVYFTQLEYAFAERLDAKSWMARALNTRGIAYRNLGNYEMAIESYNRSLKIKEATGNRKGMAATLVNIGVLYKNQKNYPVALQYQTKGLELYQELNSKKGLANVLNNMGVVYYQMGNSKAAMKYYKRSLKIREELGDVKRMSAVLHNIGSVHRDDENYRLAMDYYHRSFEIDKERNNQFGIAESLIEIGGLDRINKEYTKAELKAKEALSIATELGDVELTSNATALLFKIYKATGKYQLSLAMHEMHITARDSFNREENQRELIRNQYRFAYQTQALQDSITFEVQRTATDLLLEKQEEDLLMQRIALGSTTLGLILVIGLAISVIRGKRKSEDLLLNILPYETAVELQEYGKTKARHFEQVTVLFTDFKEFTQISERLTAQELVTALDECFKAFDAIMEKHGIEKIKTIGDSYMAAGGLPVPNSSHPIAVVKAGIEIRDWVENYAKNSSTPEEAFQIRIGINTGPVVAGIVGSKKFAYDIWGDTVNTASRMESSGEVGKVNISKNTYDLVNQEFDCTHRGKIAAKGKGDIDMYFVEGSS